MASHFSIFAWRIPGTRGAWWAAVYGVAQSLTRLKQLSSSSSRGSTSARGGGSARPSWLSIAFGKLAVPL